MDQIAAFCRSQEDKCRCWQISRNLFDILGGERVVCFIQNGYKILTKHPVNTQVVGVVYGLIMNEIFLKGKGNILQAWQN